MFTDAQFHNGPGGAHPYEGFSSMPPSFGEAMSVLNGIGAKVLGIFSGSSSNRGPLEEAARQTGAVDASGDPIVTQLNSDGTGLVDGVVNAVTTLVNEGATVVDVVVDRLSETGSDPATVTVVPLSANPASGATVEGDRFVDVKPGTTVSFAVKFANHSTSEAQSHRYRIRIRTDGATIVEEMIVQFVVPGSGVVCY